ncbi:MAG: glutathione S-transferase [Pseudomonadales bacterium]
MKVDRTLHIGNKNYSSWSLRVWLLMRELAIPFNEVLHPFDVISGNEVEFKTFAPNARVPCLHDQGQVVWDSLAIFEYLAESWPVWPNQSAARIYSRSVCAEIHSGFEAIRSQCPMNCALEIRVDDVPVEVERDLRRLDDMMVEGLTTFGGPFIGGGSFSGIDAFLAPMLLRISGYHLPLSRAARDYQTLLLARPGLTQWVKEAREEEWREPIEDEASLARGELVNDFRPGPR